MPGRTTKLSSEGTMPCLKCSRVAVGVTGFSSARWFLTSPSSPPIPGPRQGSGSATGEAQGWDKGRMGVGMGEKDKLAKLCHHFLKAVSTVAFLSYQILPEVKRGAQHGCIQMGSPPQARSQACVPIPHHLCSGCWLLTVRTSKRALAQRAQGRLIRAGGLQGKQQVRGPTLQTSMRSEL